MNGHGSFSFELKGVKELTRLLGQLPTVAMKKTVLRNALKKAGNPIAEAARANVPVVTGGLRDSITVSPSLKPSQRKGRQDRSVVTVYVGSSSPVAHLVEFGTVERTLDEPRIIKLGGRWARITTTGFVSPNPFLRRAWHAMKMPALGIFADEMKNELYKSAGRLAKRTAAGKLTAAQVRGLSK